MRSRFPILLFALAACVPFDAAFAAKPATIQEGVASFYASFFHGRTTANGERYDEQAMTAAHRTLPFGTRVRVTNLENGKSLLLRVNDRGPFVGGRIIDLSRAAAHALGFVRKGLTRVQVEVVKAARGRSDDADTAAQVAALAEHAAPVAQVDSVVTLPPAPEPASTEASAAATDSVTKKTS